MPMFDSSGQPKNMEALFNSVVSVSGASGVLFVSALNTVPTSETVQAGGGYQNITTASAINVMAGRAILESVVFHLSTTARIVLYDSTTFGNNLIATVDGVPTKLTTLRYHTPISAGITVSTVSAPGDFTITWKTQ